jgi:hypothetical protein
MTDAYNTGIEITEQLREGDSLLLSVADSSIQTEYLNDHSSLANTHNNTE